MKITRRDFFNKTIQGATIIAIPSLIGTILESCSTNSNSNPVSASSSSSNFKTIQVTPKNNVITLNVDSSSSLSTVGSAVLLQYSSGNLLVDRSDQSTFNALSAICTHQGCLITEYDPGNKHFVCPCHGSTFNLNGQVVSGPAQRALPKYQTQFNNNQLNIVI
ncbi:MAG: Rieske (2Fe-2S) protein [Ignavibacteriaceae bacterium]